MKKFIISEEEKDDILGQHKEIKSSHIVWCKYTHFIHTNKIKLLTFLTR